MRYAGKIVDWNDDRGFGFIEPNGGGNKAFLHISELKTRSRRPDTGNQVTYSVVKDSRGRLQARAVSFVEARQPAHPQNSSLPRSAIGITALALVGLALALQLLPPMIAGAYFLLSLLSFLAYMNDKRAATQNTWRTPENTLHLLDLLGGWPGGLIAQQRFHHKTIKPSFQSTFWLSVLANIGGIWWLTVSMLEN